MRILVLCKRNYTGKDLLDDRYGRLYEIPECLAGLRHEVRGVALSYRPRSSKTYRWNDAPGVRWHSINALPFGLLRYGAIVAGLTRGWKPDIIWASSDVLHILLAARLSRRHGIPFVADLYDNYESFGMAGMPGAIKSFRSACRKAAGVTVVSNALKCRVATTCDQQQKVAVVGNAVRDDLFFPRDKAASRATLDLPAHVKLIGTAGSITANRGISDMFDAFDQLARKDEHVWLVHAGPVDHIASRYKHPRIINLGALPLEVVPTFLCALDVAVVCNRDSDFGRYCFPLKFYETIACRVPLVVADVGDVGQLLANYPHCRYKPGDPNELAIRIQRHLQERTFDIPFEVPSWSDRARNLESFLRDCISFCGMQTAPHCSEATRRS